MITYTPDLDFVMVGASNYYAIPDVVAYTHTSMFVECYNAAAYIYQTLED